ncbi:MAG: hypothetical protein J6C62_07115 [Clostridia bacterium]|nr:hypothetical protein [Clostridia bacterium]
MQEGFKTFSIYISTINRNIRRLKTEIMAKYDLKCPHVSSFYYLYTDGPLTAKELCDLCQEDKGALSRSIDYLEKEGFIENVQKGRKYKVPLSLTEKGKVIGKYLVGKIDEYFNKASVGLSEADRVALFKGLAIVSENLESIVTRDD